jgi:Protein of unknown function (DUF1579)
MKATVTASALTVTLAIGLIVLPGLTRAQDAKVPPTPSALIKALAEAGKPGPEHQKLQPFIGDWDLTVRLWTDPKQPPAEAKGTVERKWILGGRFVQESVKVACEGKSFEGLGLLGYNSAEKKFTAVKACGLCGTVSHGLATCSDSGTRFECIKEECCPLTGQKIAGRDEIVIESPDRIVVNVFKTFNGTEAKVMEIVTVRRK